MSGLIENPTAWRLRSPDGAVPFKYLGVEGSFENENAGVTLKAIIPARSLIAFCGETFPPSVVVGNISIPQSKTLPGLPGLIAKRVAFKGQIDGKPVDPFGFDPAAPTGTYQDTIEVTVEYGPRSPQRPQPSQNNPFTFLEITGNTTGEIINTTAPRAKWLTKTSNKTEEEEQEDPAGKDANVATDSDEEAQKDPTVPVMIVVPQTEWTVKWKQVPAETFQNVLVTRLRWALGRVNSTAMSLLFNAEPTTILFTGYNYTQAYSWRDGLISSPPIDVEMKFTEKRVVWNNVIRGHNDFWRPGKGWETLILEKNRVTGAKRYAYESRDLNVLFRQ